MGSKSKKVNKPTSNNLEDRLNKYSFKIKPILLEFQNYNYFHTANSGKGKDGKDRFLGRRGITNKILSFIQETNSNTGAYLITGFRGMGKTSVVNRALASLNTDYKGIIYFKIWILLLPVIIFHKGFSIFSQELFTPAWTLFFSGLILFVPIFTLFAIAEMGYQEGRNMRLNQGKKAKIVKTFKTGLIALFNPKYDRSKLSFQRNLRFFFILMWSYLFVLAGIYFLFPKDTYNNIIITRHDIFWYITNGLIVAYMAINAYEERLKYVKFKSYEVKGLGKKALNREKTFGVNIILLVVVLYQIIFYWFWIKIGVTWPVFVFVIALLFFFIIFKLIWKRKRLQRNSNKYNTTLSGLRNFFDFQHYIPVHVNLGKDNLTEKEVLKFITHEVIKKYHSWFFNFRNVKRFGNTFLLLFLLYAVSTAFYRSFLGKKFTEFSATTLNIAVYFPSQSLVDQDQMTFEKVESLVKGGADGYSIDEYKRRILALLPRKKVELGNNFESKRLEDVRLDPAAMNIGYVPLEYTDGNTWDRIHLAIQKVCNEVDYLTLKLWVTARSTLILDHFNGKGYVDALVTILYPSIPILAVYFFMVVFILFFWLLPPKYSIIKGHYGTIRNFKKLKKEIDASITLEQSGDAPAISSSWLGFKKRFSYQPLDAKDISQRLTHLFEEVEGLQHLFIKVKFIIVFDELDKINPHDNSVISSKEDEFGTDTKELRYHTRRKERIALILSSMKHFLNSAKAKFIFIAGREMYDAALAGISDRESSLESIFNDNKIYVNSFYTENDDNNLSDITSITEQYLCQFLIPESFLTRNAEKPSLSLYYKYLRDEIFVGDPMIEAKTNKIITVLKDFIVYLTYRSNGAPRKLSNLVERYLVPLKEKDIVSDDILFVGNTDENLFLEIGYYSQYKFSLVSYLTSPVFLGLGNYMHEYSDKLLVSISYMLDHLYKFHKFGLSYRSLSLTPEIVDINKEPQFREFLDKLVHSLSTNHLRPILSGIYDYKFNGNIASEIRFLSKIDELEGAAFNFTLDESIELKRYFNSRLDQMKEQPSSLIIKNDGNTYEDHVNATSLLNVMIGDLHFYDEEYHDAINHYLEAIQVLRQKDIKDMNLYDFILFVRNKLKLGLAFEKNKMYDNALMTYSELTDLILRKRNVPLGKYGLARFIVKKKDVVGSFFNLRKISNYQELKWHCEKEFSNTDNTGIYRDEIVVIGRLKSEIVKQMRQDDYFDDAYYWKKLYPISDMETFYAGNPKELFDNFENLRMNFKPLKLHFLQSTGENIRLLYQPILAKLHLIEKSGPDKLKDIDVIRAIDEFNFLKMALNTKEKRIVVSEFYNKIGDLLYFKNGTLNNDLKRKIIDARGTCDPKCVEREVVLKNLLISPIDALLFYIKSLAVLLIPCNDQQEAKQLDKIKLEDFYSKKTNIKSFFEKTVQESLTRIQEKIDGILSNGSFREEYSYEYLSSAANGIVNIAEAQTGFSFIFQNKYVLPGELSCIGKVALDETTILNLYYKAHILYKEIGEHRLAKSQILKIIYLLKDIESYEKVLNSISPDLNLERLSEDCIRLIYNSYDQSYHVEIKKMAELMCEKQGKETDVNFTKLTLQNSIAMAEINEVLCIQQIVQYKEAYRKRKQDDMLKFYQFVYKHITPFTKVHRRQNRVLELSLRLRANKHLFKGFIDNQFEEAFVEEFKKDIEGFEQFGFQGKDGSNSFTFNEESKHFLILDSIGACNELLKTYYLLDINYVVTSHLSLAKAHYTMAFWCRQYKSIEIGKDRERLDEILRVSILNSKTLMYINGDYHLNLAEQYNKKARNFHSRGEPLSNFIRSASYLDDFFNDNLIHFLIAVERKEVHSLSKKQNKMVELIEDLPENNDIVSRYNSESYLLI